MSDVWGDICFDCLQVMMLSKIYDAAKNTVRLTICVLILFGYLSQANRAALVTISCINRQNTSRRSWQLVTDIHAIGVSLKHVLISVC